MKKLFLLLITTLFFTDIYSQCSTTVLPVLGGTSVNGRAPNGRFRTIRTAYLITPLEMNLAGYANGTALSGIGWNYSVAPGVSVSGTLKVYLANTVDATYNLGTDYATVSTSLGMTQVHNATTILPATAGTFDIPFVGGSPFLYTGNGIYVVFEWVDCTSILSTTAALQCNTTLVNGLVGFQTTSSAPCPAALPTAMAVSSFRPETRFSTNILNDVKVDYVYTQGELSLGNSVAVPTAARLTNLSANTYLNFPVTVDVTGANTFSATTTIASLPGCSTQYVQLSNITPTNNGVNTVTVSVPNDNNNFNNAFAVQQTVSFDKFGMRYLGQVAYPTGVGFNGASGVFCAKFSTANPIMISKVDVDFTVIGQPYRIAIYPDNSGTPGTVPLYLDAVDRITIANPIEEVLSSMVSVPAGNFYVTIHQTTTTNIGVAYAQEQPVRTNTFFYSTLPPATWTDFSVGGAQFKVLLGARICYPFPPTNLVGNATVCAGTSQTYTVDPVAGASSYVWTLPGGWTGTSTSTSITTIPSGTSGNVQCAAVFPCGTSVVTSLAVTMNPNPTITATPSLITVCAGTNVTLTGSTIGPIITTILNPSKDNSIYQENQGNSNGAGPYLLAGRINFGNFSNRALLAFNLSSIPAGATITSASLQLNCSQVPNANPQVINLHKVNENWGEGTSVALSPGAGIAATANDATWLNAFHPSTAWTTSGGVFNPTVSASTSVAGTGLYTWTNASMVSDIQSWITSPANNFGWMIKGLETATGQARRFDSRENSTPANRPQLTITYTLPSTYVWTGGITDNTPFAVTSSNVYQVTGTDANGCTNTATSSVTMNALPTVTATPASVSVCAGQSTTLTGGGASTYVWTGGITDATPFAVIASNVYQVTGTDANGCSNTATSSVTMNAAPNISTTPSASTTKCDGASVMLTASSTTPSTTFEWNPGTVASASITIPGATSGTYIATVTDGNTCTATASVVVTNTPASGILTQATAANAQSNPGNVCSIQIQPNDGTTNSYFDASCNLIASVVDAPGANALGNINTCVTVDASVQLVNGQPYLKRWYEITPTSNGPADVILYLTQDDFDDYNASPAAAGWPPLPTAPLTNYANVRITKNDAGVLSVITPTIMWDAVNNRYALSFSVTGFSQFRVHSVNNANAPLPVTYKMFTARKENTVDVLDWITGTEENNKQFNVERSANGEEFTRIGVVATKAPNGNSQVDINYTFVDEKPMTGHNYYRLAQEDIDGKISYSKTIDLIWGANGSTITMYPNPTTEVLNVDINATMASNITIRVMDMSGRTVKTTEARTEQGVNNVKINLSDVSSGIYNVQLVENGKLIATERVNKK